jgi:hypothetical protein
MHFYEAACDLDHSYSNAKFLRNELYCPGCMGGTIDLLAYLKGSYKTVINWLETTVSSSETVYCYYVECSETTPLAQ